MLLHCLSWICRRPWRTGLTVCALVGITAALFGTATPARRCPGETFVAPVATTPAPLGPTAEIGLQEALDQLGYTVNVPTSYDGRPLVLWNGYRTSTRSDAVDAARFVAGEEVTYRMLGQQAMLADTTTFGFITTDCTGEVNVPLLRPAPGGDGFWLSRENGPALRRGMPGDDLHFFLHETTDALGRGVLSSRRSDNARDPGASHLIVLPALSGGTWVDDGNRAGHWEGSTRNEGYLLCWEDADFDTDYQDMIVLVQGVRPLPR